jgi:hypothetical protein
VKGRRQYLLRFHASPQRLAAAGIVIRTVCQVNAAVLPQLKDGGSQVTFLASGKAMASAGPTLPLAQSRVVAGAFGTPAVTLEIPTPHGEAAAAVYAAAHVFSGNPPDPGVRYQIDYSTDGGKAWRPVVKDWTVARRGEEPADFWSQSLCWGAAAVAGAPAARIRVRFRNDGGKVFGRAEAHLVYQVARPDSTRVTVAWTEEGGARQAAHVFAPGAPATWELATGRNVQTRWIEFEPVIQE